MAFVTVARADDIPVGQGTLVEVNGLVFAVFNAGDGRFHVTSALCPHEDGPLAEGWIEGDAVVCPWHGFDFELASGRCRVAEDLAISVYPVRLVGGDVQADVP
jgi:nitrite reductase (NADH) small subunit/3-phenylpropionate/trans-cinnamate dioxygenase ferredoxin subunit